MSDDLRIAYRRCRQLARRAASSFCWCFWWLPRAEREAMWALYAFARHTDDIGDDEPPDTRQARAGRNPGGRPQDERRRRLAAWRVQVEDALMGNRDHPWLPALAETARRHAIPSSELLAVIDGVEMDLVPRRYQTFSDLEVYCRRVASAVGLSCLRIWGCRDEDAFLPAAQCGVAFQLTNILRDLAEDAARGRVYLPLEDLQRFSYPESALREGRYDDSFRQLMRYELERAARLYAEGAATAGYLRGPGRRVFCLMFDAYHTLLREIARRDGQVFHERVRLGLLRKVSLAVRHSLAVRPSLGGVAPVAFTTSDTGVDIPRHDTVGDVAVGKAKDGAREHGAA